MHRLNILFSDSILLKDKELIKEVSPISSKEVNSIDTKIRMINRCKESQIPDDISNMSSCNLSNFLDGILLLEE